MRVGWNGYFMQITKLVATRSTCGRRQVGAILVKDMDILATGYNGAPSKVTHCIDSGCERARLGIESGKQLDICVAIHAEQNAICQAARHGVSIRGADLYCTNTPCFTCAKLLINAGIKRVFYLDAYNDQLAIDLMKTVGLELIHVEVTCGTD